MGDLLVSKADLAEVLKDLIPKAPVRLPRYFRFPDEIREMLGGGPSVVTIRNWKTSYGLKTTKIGAASYVYEDDWFNWVKNNTKIMAAKPRNRGDRLSK
jgi:hypothetical protein